MFPLAHQHAEYIGKVLVQGPGLPAVVKVRGETLHAVGQFMTDHFKAAGKALEDQVIPIAVSHLAAIPVSVAQRYMLAVEIHFGDVHGRDQRHATVVQRVAFEQLRIEIIDVA